MKKYEFKLIIEEGNDEFWESIANKTGCDEVKEDVSRTLAGSGYFVGDNCQLTLTNFKDE